MISLYKGHNYIVKLYVNMEHFIVLVRIESFIIGNDTPNNIFVVDINNKFSIYINRKQIIKEYIDNSPLEDK